MPTITEAPPGCGCTPGAAAAADSRPAATEPASRPAPTTDLEALIPIAVVIAGGCEPCARRMVLRALDLGVSPRQVKKTLAVVGHLHRQQCFADSVGAEVIARMERPLATARRTLREPAA